MDNLTHSLAGAVLGQMGLKRKTGLAMPTLIIAANLPDIDAVATLLGGHQHLAIRRGITHGPIAMLVLPIVLWAIMIGYDRWQAGRGTRPEKRLPVHAGWLLALSYFGTLSHPALDWLNTYGIRLLEPFSSQWFYGDTLFIMDIWIWGSLIGGLWWSRRLEKRGASDWRRPARTALVLTCTYILANYAITTAAERVADDVLVSRGTPRERMVVASPVPVAFWSREIKWRSGNQYGEGHYSLIGGLQLPVESYYNSLGLYQKAEIAKTGIDARAYLFWSRMPYAEIKTDGTLVIRDQRFDASPVRGNFELTVKQP